MITISPDYDLLLKIILSLWVLRGTISIIAGVTKSDVCKRDVHGSFDIVAGVVALLLAAWVML